MFALDCLPSNDGNKNEKHLIPGYLSLGIPVTRTFPGVRRHIVQSLLLFGIERVPTREDSQASY